MKELKKFMRDNLSDKKKKRKYLKKGTTKEKNINEII